MAQPAELWAANALWPGQAIVEQLRAQVSGLRQVLLVDDYDPGAATPKQLPAAIVLLYELRVTTQTGTYDQPANCAQDWMVALAVRSARADADAESAQVGTLLPQVVAALHGYRPDGVNRRFNWAQGPRPNYGATVSYYPLIFSMREVMA